MHKGRNFSRVVGGRGGDLKEDWLGLYCWNAWILTLFKAKCIQIAKLFRTLNSEIKYFFNIEDPINLYHAVRHILSDPNMEVSQPPKVWAITLLTDKF